MTASPSARRAGPPSPADLARLQAQLQRLEPALRDPQAHPELLSIFDPQAQAGTVSTVTLSPVQAGVLIERFHDGERTIGQQLAPWLGAAAAQNPALQALLALPGVQMHGEYAYVLGWTGTDAALLEFPRAALTCSYREPRRLTAPYLRPGPYQVEATVTQHYHLDHTWRPAAGVARAESLNLRVMDGGRELSLSRLAEVLDVQALVASGGEVKVRTDLRGALRLDVALDAASLARHSGVEPGPGVGALHLDLPLPPDVAAVALQAVTNHLHSGQD